jgi:hypothetical protein
MKEEVLSAVLKFGLDTLLAHDEGTIDDHDLDQILSLHDDTASTEEGPEQEQLEEEPDTIYYYAGQDYSKVILTSTTPLMA